jgi:hypothetical protein
MMQPLLADLSLTVSSACVPWCCCILELEGAQHITTVDTVDLSLPVLLMRLSDCVQSLHTSLLGSGTALGTTPVFEHVCLVQVLIFAKCEGPSAYSHIDIPALGYLNAEPAEPCVGVAAAQVMRTCDSILVNALPAVLWLLLLV